MYLSRSSTTTTLVLVLLSGVPLGSDAYHDAQKCLVEFVNNTEGIGTCFQAFQSGPYGQCFNDTSIVSFKECMDADPGVADPWECGGVMTCAYDTYTAGAKAYLDGMGGLDACVGESVQAFVKCGISNLASCSEPCHDIYSEDTTTLFPAITSSSVSACDAFQTDVADVACGPTSCCPACQDGLDSVMECIAKTVYQLECELECTGGDQVASPAGATRRHLAYELRDRQLPLGLSKTIDAAVAAEARSRILQEEEETLDVHVAGECPLSLVNSTTLQSLAATPALFMDCVALHYLWMFTEEGMAYVLGAAGNETSSGGEEGAASASADGEADADADAAAGATSASSPSSYEGLFTPVAIVSAILVIVSAVFV
jgi:hypothetical protein